MLWCIFCNDVWFVVKCCLWYCCVFLCCAVLCCACSNVNINCVVSLCCNALLCAMVYAMLYCTVFCCAVRIVLDIFCFVCYTVLWWVGYSSVVCVVWLCAVMSFAGSFVLCCEFIASFLTYICQACKHPKALLHVDIKYVFCWCCNSLSGGFSHVVTAKRENRFWVNSGVYWSHYGCCNEPKTDCLQPVICVSDMCRRLEENVYVKEIGGNVSP